MDDAVKIIAKILGILAVFCVISQAQYISAMVDLIVHTIKANIFWLIISPIVVPIFKFIQDL